MANTMSKMYSGDNSFGRSTNVVRHVATKRRGTCSQEIANIKVLQDYTIIPLNPSFVSWLFIGDKSYTEDSSLSLPRTEETREVLKRAPPDSVNVGGHSMGFGRAQFGYSKCWIISYEGRPFQIVRSDATRTAYGGERRSLPLACALTFGKPL